MLQLIAVILLAVSGTLGGLWGGHYIANRPATNKTDSSHGKAAHETVLITPEIFVVPILTETEVKGFLVNRFVFGTDPSVPNETGIDDQTLLADAFYQVAFNGAVYRPNETVVPDSSGVADMMLEKANRHSAKARFTSVYIQQVDFFNRSEVRRKVVEERPVPE